MTKKILVLHDLSVGSRRTNRDHVYSFAKYEKDNVYLFHSANALVTDALKSIKYDGVIINYCFLGYRASNLYPLLKARYAWLRELACPKIAICQDDYTDSAILDEWLEFMGVTTIYSPIQRNVKVLYPRNWGKKTFKLGLTAYTDSAQMDELRLFQKPFSERAIDIGTRVRYLPPQFGRYGQIKGKSAEDFRDAAKRSGFAVNISTDPQDVMFGSDWLRFMGDCKFTLGSKGGASLNDPRGMIRKEITQYLVENPGAEFSEVERECFPGLDGRYVFAGVSPRLFEAAALKTCQILVRDEYIGGIEPYIDYIPLDDDLSNLEEVFSLMRDEEKCQRMIESCHEKLIASKLFDYSVFVADVLSEIKPSPQGVGQEDAELIREHFEGLRPFLNTKEKYGGFFERLWGRVLGFAAFSGATSYVRAVFDLPGNLSSCPSATSSLLDSEPPGTAVGAAAEVLSIARFLEIDTDDLQYIAEHAVEKEYVYEELDVWWDMCECIYEPEFNEIEAQTEQHEAGHQAVASNNQALL